MMNKIYENCGSCFAAEQFVDIKLEDVYKRQVGCAVISIVFCMVLNGVAGAYGRWFKNPYVRVVVGSCLVIGITLLLGTSDYMGAGAELIEKAVEEGQARPLDFFWKLVLTALTMRAGSVSYTHLEVVTR